MSNDLKELPDSKAVARARVRRALALIEQAQNTLNEACAQLSPVTGFVRDWERVGKVADQVNAAWHRLNGRDDSEADLDGDAKRAAAAPQL